MGTGYGHVIVHQPPKIPQPANLTLALPSKLCVNDTPAFKIRSHLCGLRSKQLSTDVSVACQNFMDRVLDVFLSGVLA